ncbi:hypothetical protein GCM10019059_45120 [Camelimonas fluminis]|uniref:Uncharacterized protein n=1 Tax=Camelimonas fluminis TaxID=1576911 RepID=A0ABV7UK13_9HYPH|nr:hypothetical protein [Camelimonas fluminis]GHE83021.1 hypothetical protein GCM10019059_45120 [Camelimonas fluminis]
MKIHVYNCTTTPDHRRFMAIIETVENVPANGECPAHKRQTFLPITCFGATMVEARVKAEDFWQGKLDNEARRNERARAAGERAKARTKGGDADG